MPNTGWFITEGNEPRGPRPRGYCKCREGKRPVRYLTRKRQGFLMGAFVFYFIGKENITA